MIKDSERISIQSVEGLKAVDLGITPFYVQLPPGYSLASASNGTGPAQPITTASNSTASSAAPIDTISISNQLKADILHAAAGTRSTINTLGDSAAPAGESYRVASVFTASDTTAGKIESYHVALNGQGSGQLLLNGVNVTSRTNFTTDEYNSLIYITGSDGTQQNLTVIAQAATPKLNGTVANLTNSRVNVLTGAGTDRPIMQTQASVAPPLSLDALSAATGSYQTSGTPTSIAPFDLGSVYANAIGSYATTGSFTNPASSLIAALLMLGGGAIGAYQSGIQFADQSTAIRAYQS